MSEKKSKENQCEELKNLLSKSNSRTSMTSKTSDRVSPEGQMLPNFCPDTSFTETPNAKDTTDFVKLKHSLGTIFSEVNPLYDPESVNPKAPSKPIKKAMGEFDSPSGNHRRGRSIRNFVAYPYSGIDDADGTFITKTKFLQKWSEHPEMIIEPYNVNTEETVMHFLAREGKFDVLRDLVREHKNGNYIYQALKVKDKFGQTPMLSAISASENRNEILKFLLNLIYENSSDSSLQEVAILNCNRHNDTILTLLMKNYEVFRETRQIFFKIFSNYYTKRDAQPEGLYNIIYQILQQNSCDVNSKSLSDILRELAMVSPRFFKEDNHLFGYKSPKTQSNILMELAKSAKDDALREILVNRQTYRHVTHKVLQERNLEGQTLLAIIEVNRVNLAECLPIVLKKEYGCHRRDMLKTEQCLARQLESSMSAGQIILELNDLENANSFAKRSKIWMILFVCWLCPTVGITFFDIFFDSLLAIEYYHQFNNITYVQQSIEKCERCQEVFLKPEFNTTRTTLHCFESCFSTEARLGYTLTFLLLPILFYLTEFLTLTDRYEVTTLRHKVTRSLQEISHNCWNPLKLFAGILKFITWFSITIFVIIFWQPITALFKFYRDGIYETSTGNKRVDARIRKRRSDLTCSRGELIEVNCESAFEPIIQGYIIFPNIIDIAEKIGNMVSFKEDGKVEVSLAFTTVETAQLISIGTSMVSLAWCYSEYHSVRKNMLLDITVSPCSRVTMFLYMLMQIIARLLAFQLFALYWGPGQLYPLIIFVVIHMFLSCILHVFFSEDLFYVRKGKYLKFFHNTMMNAFATIYFHNYLRMDEMPKIEKTLDVDVREEIDAQTPGLHISTFVRQIAFDVLYYSEFVVLLGFGFSAQIVKDGFLGLYTNTFIWIVTTMTVLSLVLKFFYYDVLHIWSNTIFTMTRIKSQPFQFMGGAETYDTENGETHTRFVEYVFISSNSWFLGKLKTVKTTILILPKRLIKMIEGQGTQLGTGILDPFNAATGGIGAIEQWKSTARNLLHWRKTIALLCFLPLIMLGIFVPLVIILVLVTALVLSLPLMIILLLYNVFTNCNNVLDKTMVDNDEFIDRDIEDLPPEIDSIENLIFSCDPALTLRKIQADLSSMETLDLSSKPDMSVEELENITVLLLSLNPRRYKMRVLKLDDSRLTDDKLKTLAPLIVRFHTVKIGGKQDFGEEGLEQLRLYMEHVYGSQPTAMDDEIVPLVKCEKILLRRLEIKQSKAKKGVTDLTWVNEEVKGFEHEDEKTLMVNELAHMIPYLTTLILDGFLREIRKNKENQLWQLWEKLNFVDHLEILSLRDCEITDRIILKCLIGISNVKNIDLSGNPDITYVGWKGLAETVEIRKGKCRIVHLAYQNAKHTIDENAGEQFAKMFLKLHKLDLRGSQISDEAVEKFLEAFGYKEPHNTSTLEKLDLSGCNVSQASVLDFHEINRRKASDVILFKALDLNTNKRKCCGCFNKCCP
eukprot:GFUD01005921.1.p1 GENE.GFUD01005921.1~~GFUD01005921.1.p1  ORF type:complete len:1477 (-),score=243.09 GFUD01005921.1:84-4514(-)